MRVTPKNSLMGGLPGSILTPPKSNVLIDAIGFRPIASLPQ
jgi:hypothetical protein